MMGEGVLCEEPGIRLGHRDPEKSCTLMQSMASCRQNEERQIKEHLVGQ